MGYCPCFGFRKGKKLKSDTDEEKDVGKTTIRKPEENVAQLSSGQLIRYDCLSFFSSWFFFLFSFFIFH